MQEEYIDEDTGNDGEGQFYINGLPFSNNLKVLLVLIFFVALIGNHTLTTFFGTDFDYPYRDIVSLVLIAFIIIVSLGSVLAESIVLGIVVIGIVSNIWDLVVRDWSDFRVSVLIGLVVCGFVMLIFGKIGFAHLISILKGQSGN